MSAGPVNSPCEGLVVILAPFGQDATLIAGMLASADIAAQCVFDMEAFAQWLPGCAVGVLTTESLSPEWLSLLQVTLHRQPPWSDVPLILLTATIDPATYALLSRTLSNVTIIQRPLDPASLLTVVQTALRARQKQYQVRDLLAAAEKRQADIEVLNLRLRRSMQETHHRVKNNLQVIAAMIEMQEQEHQDEDAVPLEVFRQLKAHVHTLSIVHDLLTRNVKEEENAQRVSVKTVLERLLPILQQTAWRQEIHFRIEDAALTSKQCIALSLILNELVTNALKHGKRTADVHFHTEGPEALLEVWDDGSGFPADFSPVLSANMGLELVESLSRTDLKGTTHYQNRPEGGGSVTVAFPLPSLEE